MMEDNSKNNGNFNNSNPAMGINSDEAKQMFREYHGVPLNTPATLADSHGVLTTWNGTNRSPLQHFVVDYTTVIEALQVKVEQAALYFMGLAGIPARNNQGDTFIWVAVVADDSSGTNRRLFLPGNNTENDFIYDHIETCPALCNQIQNQDNLWKNWLSNDV